MSRYTKFILTIGLQVVVIIAVVLFKLAVLGQGTEVVLGIKPIDPKDPLRGDYISFSYTISQVGYTTPGQQFRVGDVVYVQLRKAGSSWLAGELENTIPSSGKVFIKGRVTNIQTNKNSYNVYDIEYGIEQYFIPEGSGSNASLRGSDNYAVVQVDADGNAVLKQVLVNGKPWP